MNQKNKNQCVVTVTFTIKPGYAEEFMDAMMDQARNSLHLEPDCHVFDVCVDAQDESRVFLYEVYSSRAAFDEHLESDHFLDFSATVSSWVEDKEVRLWNLQGGNR